MIRQCLSLFFLLLLLVLSGCSYRYDFVVINASEGTIAVQYQLKRWTPVSPGKDVNVEAPAKVSVEEFQKAEYNWRELSRDDYLFDKVTGTFIVNVLPGEVLLIDHTSNYLGDESQFDLARIKITGAKGSLELDGHQAQTQFKLEGETKYIIRYR